MAIGLADRAERDLGDLRPRSDDDHPLAEDRAEAPRPADRLDVRQVVERIDELVLGQAVDFDLDFRLGRIGLERSNRSHGPDAAAALGQPIDDGRHRRRPLEDVEPGGGGSRLAGARASHGFDG